MAISFFRKAGSFTLLTVFLLLLASGCSSQKTHEVEVPGETAKTEWKCAGVMAEESWRCAGDGQYPSVSEFKPVEPSQPTEEFELLDESLQPDLELQNSTAVAESIANTDESDEAVILNTPNDYFAIQLAALADIGETDSFREQYGIANLLQVRLESNDQLWFVLLAGVYNSYDEAQQVVDNLLEENPDLSPWIRPIAGLQQAINRAKLR